MWIITPVMISVASMHGSMGEMLRFVVPTELAASTLAWTPGGSSVMTPQDAILARAMLLCCWIIALAMSWIALMRTRWFYPSDIA